MANEHIREENIREVQAAALELFSECGVEASSVPQIAKRAGVSLRSVYRYYENKDALVVATVKTAILEIEDSVRQVVHSETYRNLQGIDQVMCLCRKILSIAKEKCKLQVCLIEAESYLTRIRVRDMFSLSSDVDNDIIRWFKDAFEKGVLDGTVKKQSFEDENVFFTLAIAFRGFYNRIATIYVNEELCKLYKPEKIIDNFLSGIYDSISTR